MRISVSHALNPDLDASLKVSPLKKEHWNNKLKKKNDEGLDNFPLAPSDLKALGLVTRENYLKENRKYGIFCANYLKHSLLFIQKHTGIIPHATFASLGAGLSREWTPGLIKLVKRLGMDIEIYDLSDVAIAIAEKKFRDKARIYQQEISSLRGLMPPETQVAYAGNFIQVQKRMRRLQQEMGSLLLSLPGRYAIYVHAFGKDNSGPREWAGHKFESVKWGDTTPYSWADLLRPVCKGLRGAVEVLNIEQHWYFHQCYTAFMLRKKA